MRVLLISNMYPSSQKPYAGIFVKNQYEYIHSYFEAHGGGSIDIFYMQRTFTSPIMSLVKYVGAFFRFIPYLWKPYDVLHLHYFFPLYIVAYLYKLIHPKARIVVTFHGGDIHTQVKEGVNAGFFRYLAKKIDFAIAVGKDLGEIVEQKLRKKTDLVLSAGIDTKIFYPEPTNEFLYDCTYVGSFIHRKGIDIFLEAIRLIDRKDIRFCCVGSGEYAADIRKAAANYNITLKENLTQPALRGIYSQSKFFVFPSRNEPFGLVATEALYCGTPAIVSSNGGLKEQVVSGLNGYVLEENTPTALAKKMQEALAMDAAAYKEMRVQAAKSNAQYSLEQVCLKLLSIYKDLISRA